MKARLLYSAGALVALLGISVPFGLNARYPQLSTLEATSYVVQRVGTLARELLIVTPYDAQEPAAVELANVRQIALSLNPDLEALEPLSVALAIRDMIYRRVPIELPPTGFDYSNLDRAVFLELTDPRFGDICGGLSIIYVALLQAFDIEARYVGMFTEAVNAPDPVISHASVEAFIDGRWIALDPTFNFSVHFAGRRIGWQEARALTLAGQTVAFESDGYEIRPGGSVYDYPDPLTEALEFMIFAPTARTALQKLPADWDGVIRYANGHEANQHTLLTQAPVYLKLAAH